MASSIVITNRTAFPLNIALVRILPLRYINALEPGESWTTTPPSSYLPEFPSASAGPPPSPVASQPSPNFMRPVLQIMRRSLGPLTSSTTVIEVRFDHEHNRFCRSTGLRSAMLALLRIAGYLSLLIGAAILLCRKTCAAAEAFTRIDVPGLGLSLLGLLLLACSRIGDLRQSCQSSPPRKKPLLTIPVSTSSLRPPSSPSPISLSLPPTPLVEAAPRAHRHFAVTWKLGKVALWDVQLEQEVLPGDPNGP